MHDLTLIGIVHKKPITTVLLTDYVRVANIIEIQGK